MYGGSEPVVVVLLLEPLVELLAFDLEAKSVCFEDGKGDFLAINLDLYLDACRLKHVDNVPGAVWSIQVGESEAESKRRGKRREKFYWKPPKAKLIL